MQTKAKQLQNPDADSQSVGYEQQVVDYRDFFVGGEDSERERRRAQYQELVTGYFNLATDFYLWGWGESFHFAPRRRGERLKESIERYELRLAETLGLRPGMHALDLGCGVGGPMRNIAKHTGATITGINNNVYQLAKARQLVRGAAFADRCRFVRANFMRLPLPDNAIPAIYSIEAVPHAPNKRALFSEVFRVLRPGGVFVASDWCLTDGFRADSDLHRRVRDDIELGNGLPALTTMDQVRDDLLAAGFEIDWWSDVAAEPDATVPWYWPLVGRPRSPMNFLRAPLGRSVVATLLRGGERLRLVPRGAAAVQEFLSQGADALVAGGKSGIFTPLLCFRAQKPVS